MNYALAKSLKEAGFKFDWSGFKIHQEDLYVNDWDKYMKCYEPSLSELIEAVGFCFTTLIQEHNDRTPEGYLKFSGWKAIATDATCGWVGKGSTPEIAVAELWLKLNDK